jgi:hypothetical protein
VLVKDSFTFSCVFNITEMSDKIKVVIKVRRLVDREELEGLDSQWEVKNNSISQKGKYGESYSFGKLLILTVHVLHLALF